METTLGTRILFAALIGAAGFSAAKELFKAEGYTPWVSGVIAALVTLGVLGADANQMALANGHHASASLNNPDLVSLFSEADLVLETPRREGSVAIAAAPTDPYQLDMLR
jgi:hypothetical protein